MWLWIAVLSCAWAPVKMTSFLPGISMVNSDHVVPHQWHQNAYLGDVGCIDWLSNAGRSMDLKVSKISFWGKSMHTKVKGTNRNTNSQRERERQREIEKERNNTISVQSFSVTLICWHKGYSIIKSCLLRRKNNQIKMQFNLLTEAQNKDITSSRTD